MSRPQVIKTNSPIELMGDATYEQGSWFGHKMMDAPMVGLYRDNVKVYGNQCKWFLTPATARSMATALNHFADRAEAFESGVSNE